MVNGFVVAGKTREYRSWFRQSWEENSGFAEYEGEIILHGIKTFYRTPWTEVHAEISV
jgi:hypothetical protein